jgi:dolichol-phosphate mannosyltransferase
MTSSPILSIVLPAYEEAANLGKLLPELHGVARMLTSEYEILVIDSAEPRDATPEVCRKNGVRHIPRTGGSFYGSAVCTGFRQSTGRYVVMMDADGSHHPNFIAELWPHREKYDLVIASRYVRGGQTENPPGLIFLSLLVNLTFRLVLNLPCHDVSNSFRLYRGDEVRALQLECVNFDIVEEILVKLNRQGDSFRVKEVPFTFEKRKEGKTKRNLITFAISFVVTLYKLRRMSRPIRPS